MGGQDRLAASSQGAGREGPRPAELQDGTEASGLSSLTAAWSPTPAGLLAAKADGAGIRGFCTRAPPPVGGPPVPHCWPLGLPLPMLEQVREPHPFWGRGRGGKPNPFYLEVESRNVRSWLEKGLDSAGQLGHPHPAHPGPWVTPTLPTGVDSLCAEMGPPSLPEHSVLCPEA